MGGAETPKFGPIPQFGDFCSKFKFICTVTITPYKTIYIVWQKVQNVFFSFHSVFRAAQMALSVYGPSVNRGASQHSVFTIKECGPLPQTKPSQVSTPVAGTKESFSLTYGKMIPQSYCLLKRPQY